MTIIKISPKKHFIPGSFHRFITFNIHATATFGITLGGCLYPNYIVMLTIETQP